MSEVFPVLSKNPVYPAVDGPDVEEAGLVSEAKLGDIQGRERFESNLRKLTIVFQEMTINDKVTLDNFVRTVRTGVIFEFGANLAGNYYIDQDVQRVRFSELPEYTMSGYNRWKFSMQIEVRGL